MIKSKTCKQCNESKEVHHFHVKSDTADGFYPICKDCRREKEGRVKRKPAARGDNPNPTMEELVTDLERLAANNPRQVRFRTALREVLKNPNGPHSDTTSNVMFEIWHMRQKALERTEELDRTNPVLSSSKERRIVKEYETPFCEGMMNELYGFWGGE